MKKLYLSKEDKKISGVAGGIAEYFEIDSTILRVAFVFMLIFTGFIPGVIFYILATLIIPENKNIEIKDTK